MLALAATFVLTAAGGIEPASRVQVTPLVREVVTDAGLRVWSFPDDGGDRFLLMVLVGAGSRHEDPAGTGVAHLLEHVLLSSTELRSKREANRQLDALGGRFNGYTAHEVTTYHIACDPDDWEFAVEWLAEHVVTPGFDPDDVADERGIVYEEVRVREPHASASTIEEHLYPGHPLGEPIGGAQEGIRRLSTDDLRAFYGAHYRAPNMAVGFAGRVDADRVMAAVADAFGGLPTEGGVAPIEAVEPRFGRKLLGSADRLDRPGFVIAGYHMPAGATADTAAQMLVARYLSTRLFEEIREARQLSYGPRAHLQLRSDTARLDLNVEVSDSRKLPTVMAVFDDLISELAAPDAETFDSAARSAAGAFDVSTAARLGEAMELGWLMRRVGASPVELQAALAATGPDDVARYAEAHLTRDRSFAVSNAPLGGGRAPVLALLLGIALLFAVLDGARGFPMARRLRSLGSRVPSGKRRPRPSRPGKAPDAIRPVHVDELERSIQDFFADEDRKGESSEGR